MNQYTDHDDHRRAVTVTRMVHVATMPETPAPDSEDHLPRPSDVRPFQPTGFTKHSALPCYYRRSIYQCLEPSRDHLRSPTSRSANVKRKNANLCTANNDNSSTESTIWSVGASQILPHSVGLVSPRHQIRRSWVGIAKWENIGRQLESEPEGSESDSKGEGLVRCRGARRIVRRLLVRSLVRRVTVRALWTDE